MLYVMEIVDTGHGLSLDDLERLKVKVTNGTVTAIGMWGYTPVGLTGVLVFYCVTVEKHDIQYYLVLF